MILTLRFLGYIFAGLLLAISLAGGPARSAPGGPTPDRHQGWGLAIAHKAIGDNCPGALTPAEMQALIGFIAAGSAAFKVSDPAFDTAGFMATYEAEMQARYRDPANCTAAAIAGARAAAGVAANQR